MSARRKVLEQLLVEATGNRPRGVVEGSVDLRGDGLLTWSEKSRGCLDGRSSRVDWEAFWDLVDLSLSPGAPS